MTNQSNKLTSDEIQLLQKFGIDSASNNLKAEIENTLKNSNEKSNQNSQNPHIIQEWDLETLTIETERLTLKPISL